MDRVPFVVVGGGISGLSFARYVGAQLGPDQCLVLEAQDEVGGYCRTVKQDGFIWDYSGHFFHFRHPDIERDLVERIGAHRVRRVQKQARIYFADRLVDFPFQKNIHQLPERDFYACLLGLVEAAEQRGGSPKDADNFEQMLYQKFGQGIADRFLVPYNEKLYAASLSKLDVHAMGRFFPHADLKTIVAGFLETDDDSYNATFTYPEGGAIEYVHAIQRDVPETQIALSEPVVAIDLERRIARTRRRTIGFDQLVSTAPFPKLLALCGREVDPDVYSHNKVLVFNLGFDRKGPEGLHWIYYPQRDVCFYRVGFYDNIFGTDRLSCYVELGYPAGAVLDAAAIDAARQQVLADLSRVGVTDGHRLVSAHHVVLDPAYVHISGASNRAVAAEKAALQHAGVHAVGRYGSWTYCSIEDNIVEARELAARLTR